MFRRKTYDPDRTPLSHHDMWMLTKRKDTTNKCVTTWKLSGNSKILKCTSTTWTRVPCWSVFEKHTECSLLMCNRAMLQLSSIAICFMILVGMIIFCNLISMWKIKQTNKHLHYAWIIWYFGCSTTVIHSSGQFVTHLTFNVKIQFLPLWCFTWK